MGGSTLAVILSPVASEGNESRAAPDRSGPTLSRASPRPSPSRWQAFATVKRQGSSERFKCEVKAVAHECDLALLAVEDPRFWREPTPMQPLELGDVPQLQVMLAGGRVGWCVWVGCVGDFGGDDFACAGHGARLLGLGAVLLHTTHRCDA